MIFREHTYVEYHVKRNFSNSTRDFWKKWKILNLILISCNLQQKECFLIHASYNLIFQPIIFKFCVAHLVEHHFCMRTVPGSNPQVAYFAFFIKFMSSQVRTLPKKSNLQHLSTLMPPPSGSLYGHPEQP